MIELLRKYRTRNRHTVVLTEIFEGWAYGRRFNPYAGPNGNWFPDKWPIADGKVAVVGNSLVEIVPRKRKKPRTGEPGGVEPLR